MDIRKGLAGLACAALLMACNATTEARLGMMAIEYQQMCAGSWTVECVDLRVEHNVLALEGVVRNMENQEEMMLNSLTAEEYAAGMSALALAIELNEEDRPNIISRNFFGDSEVRFEPQLGNLLLTPAEVEQLFVLGVKELRAREGGTAQGAGTAENSLDVDDGEAIESGDTEIAPEESFATSELSDPPRSNPSARDCLDRWIKVHRSEMGEEAIVTADQIGEWEQWCEEGLEPEGPAAVSTANVSLADIRPSFNCSKASTTAEHLICTNQDLATADVRLMQIYREAIQCTSTTAGLKQAQRSWISERRDACADVSCMLDAYGARSAELGHVCNS